MDEPDLDPALRAEAFAGIERISHWWGQRRPLLSAIERLLGPPSSATRKLIEVGAGSGHLSRWIQAELENRGHRIEMLATDLWPGPGVSRLDCLDQDQPEAEIYFSNLLLHHLQDWDLCRMLSIQAGVAKLGSVHFDLQRHAAHYQIARFRTRFARLPEINQIDALLSIQQGFSRAELAGLIRAAGLRADIQWSFPFRWLITLKK